MVALVFEGVWRPSEDQRERLNGPNGEPFTMSPWPSSFANANPAISNRCGAWIRNAFLLAFLIPRRS